LEPFVQGTTLVGIAQFAQQSANVIRPPPSLFDQTKRGGEGDALGQSVFIDAALENAALRGSIGINSAGAIFAQRCAGLGKVCDRRLRPRERNRQSVRLQLLRVVDRSEPDVIEERAIAAQSAGKAESFAGSHASASGSWCRQRKPAFRPNAGERRYVTRRNSRFQVQNERDATA